MKLHIEEAEEKLISTLNGRMSAPEMGCCLQINGKLFDEATYKNLPAWIVDWIGESHTEIFMCSDKDIFVFSPHINHSSFLSFKNILQEHFRLEKTMSLTAFYNLDESALALIEVAQSKLLKRKKDQTQKQLDTASAEKAVRAQKFMNFFTTQDHTAMLHKKRTTRQVPQILIVEDDEFSRKLLVSAIGDRYLVECAKDGFTALTTYLSCAPDIVFLDINLPDVTGLDVLIKILSVDPDAYPVMLSGNSSLENIQSAMMLGAKGFVGKPFTKDKVLKYISKAKENYAVKAMG